MEEALMEKLYRLPKETLVCCGHEYTVSNLEFAAHVDPNNVKLKEKLKWAIERREKGLSTVPSTIGEEIEYNPFMRVDNKEIRNTIGVTASCSNAKVMELLREMKNTM